MGGWRTRGRPLLLGAVAAALVLGGGCGGAAETTAKTAPEVRRDRYTYARGLFNEMCAGCHTLADAGARGKRSNLDTSVVGRIERRAREYVTRVAMAEDPSKGGFMPRWKGVLTDRDFEALVAYVVAVAGKDRS